MDKKMLMTAAIVVAFLASSVILVTMYNPESEDKEINLVARVNTEGSGIYLDDDYSASDFIEVNPDGTPARDSDGGIIYKVDAWRGKIFGTPGSTSIQHTQLRDIVTEQLGLKFVYYDVNVPISNDSVYYQANIANAAAFESSSNSHLVGGIVWQPQYQALLESTARPCVSLMTTADFDPGHACCVIAGSHEFLKSHQDETVRFLVAYIKAVDWVNAALADKTSDMYDQLVDIAMEKTGISNPKVIEESLASVVYTYGMSSPGDTLNAPLLSLEGDVQKVLDSFLASGDVKSSVYEKMGFSSTHEFAQRFVDDGYLKQALEYDSGSTYRSSIKVCCIAGDIHQIAVHVGVSLGYFDEMGIAVDISATTNGGNVAVTLQNGDADLGFLGVPPITTTVVNGGLSNS